MKTGPKTMHPMDSFGITKVSLNSIRIDKLQERIHPTVAFPHKHDFYQLILVLDGTGIHEIDFHQHKILKDQIFIMKPGQIHTWILDKNINGIVIEFNRNSLEMGTMPFIDLIGHLDFSMDMFLFKKNSNFQLLKNLAELMLYESKEDKPMLEVSLRGLLTTFLVQVIRLTGIKANEKLKTEGVVEKFKDLVEKHFKQQHRVEFYATELGITPKALTMKVTRHLGQSPRQIIQERFLLEAKRYLAYSDLSIAEIGYEIGFEDVNYFTRFFRLHERSTPVQFRRRSSI